MLKVDDLRNLNKDDLTQKLNGLYEELVKLNYKKRTGALDKSHHFREVRKDIARIKTVMRELVAAKAKKS